MVNDLWWITLGSLECVSHDYSGYCYGNEWVIVLISRAHTAERVTDYPAGHWGQPQSIPVEIIQFANGFNAGVRTRMRNNIQSHCEPWQDVEEAKTILSLLMMPEIQTWRLTTNVVLFPFICIKDTFLSLSLISGEIIGYLSFPFVRGICLALPCLPGQGWVCARFPRCLGVCYLTLWLLKTPCFVCTACHSFCYFYHHLQSLPL